MARASDMNDAEQDPLNAPVDATVEGQYMKAFLVAHNAFVRDRQISEAKRQIQNYTVEFRQIGNFYFVLFYAKRNPSERGMKGGASELGQDVMYKIRKSDYQISEKTFFK